MGESKGWNPAAINSEEEYNFLRLGQRTFRNNDPYWVSGSTNRGLHSTFNFTYYNATDDGKVYI